jgi:hypothetical protein
VGKTSCESAKIVIIPFVIMRVLSRWAEININIDRAETLTRLESHCKFNYAYLLNEFGKGSILTVQKIRGTRL